MAMGSISGIPSTRVSDLYVRQMLLGQITYNQSDLFRLQQQMSSGQRFQLPSQDPAAAQQAGDLQRIIARKAQAKANLQSNQSYLGATDTALRTVADLINSARTEALGATGTLVTDEQRTAAAQQVSQILQQLVDLGNQNFRGRYLFAGSETQAAPFLANPAGLVEFQGNEVALKSYADVGLAFDTNVSGVEAFGAVSQGVRGSVDVNPALTADTALSSLHGGLGVAAGSIAISDGVNTSVIDLTGAATIGDVAAEIYSHPPEGRKLQVEVRGDGLWLKIEGGGPLIVSEVAQGTAAKDLGILTAPTAASDTVVGQDLDPTVNATTRLADLLGRRSRVMIRSTAVGSGVLFEAGHNGSANDGIQVQFVDDPSVQKEHETVQYDVSTRTLTVHFAQSQSTAQDVVNAVHAAFVAGNSPLDAQLDPSQAYKAGQGVVNATTGTTAGGSGADLDKSAGLELVNSSQTHDVNFDAATTVEDLLNTINLSGAGLLAEINVQRRGIDIRSRVSGADFSIGEHGGTTAAQLGVRSLTASTRLDALNHGLGISEPTGTTAADFTITKADGTQLAIDVQGAATIQDVLDRINQNPQNDPAHPLTARLALSGNGIELYDTSTGANSLTITRAAGNPVAERLGLLAAGENSRSVPVGGPPILTGGDPNPQETDGLYTALIRLQKALEQNNQAGIQRAVEMLDRGTTRLNFTQAAVGARQQTIATLLDRNASEAVELKDNLSQEVDVDFTQAVSDFNGRQLAYQASLKASATVFKMSLLDYL